MMDISIYLKSIELDSIQVFEQGIYSKVNFYNHQEDFVLDKGIAIVDVPEYRASINIDENDSISWRNQFYQLKIGVNWDFNIYDLGSILPGENINDTYYAIQEVCAFLLKKNVLPIFIGGGQDLAYAIYKAYGSLEQLVNISNVDLAFDLGNGDLALGHGNWLSKVIMDRPCYLFNFNNVGAQSHYINVQEQLLFEDLHFDVIRFGEISNDISLAEPAFRNADFICFDLTSIRSSDFKGKFYYQPNGFFAHQVCQLSRYAGISDKVTIFALLNFFPSEVGKNESLLIAQMIWYFMDGYANRKGDFPIGSKKNYKKYRVFFEEHNHEILFLKSHKTGRWWMDVPVKVDAKQKYSRHQLVPCSYKVYQEAMKGEIPLLWLKTQNKLG